VIRNALLCMLEVVECRLEALETQRCGGWVLFADALGVLEMPEVICSALSYMLEAVDGG